jgi:hypothetical protein
MAFSTKGLKKKTIGVITRRKFIKTTLAAGALVGTGGLIFPRYGAAKPKTLKILQMAHFVPAFDQWFKNTYVKEWGDKNDTQVIVDHVSILELLEMPVAEVSAQKGHDLVMFIRPPPAFEDHVIDHREISEECENKYGKAMPMAMKSTYNPRTKKYYGFSDSFAPDPTSLTALLQIRSTTARISGMAWVCTPIPGRMCASAVPRSKKNTAIRWVSVSLRKMTLVWPCGLLCTPMGRLFKMKRGTWSSTQSRP